MGEWKRGVPTTPGRYWWRAEPRREGWMPEYGLALVRWVDYREHAPHMKPKLEVRSTVCFSTGFHTDTDDGYGWASGTTVPDGAEFWSEQLVAPEGLFLAAVPGLGPAPSPEAVREREEQSAAQREEAARKRLDAACQITRAMDEAVAEKATLVLCTSCDEVYRDTDAVVLRECPHCEEGAFDGSEGPHCPTCNRPFTRNTGERGCPECLTDVQEGLVAVDGGIRTEEGVAYIEEERGSALEDLVVEG